LEQHSGHEETHLVHGKSLVCSQHQRDKFLVRVNVFVGESYLTQAVLRAVAERLDGIKPVVLEFLVAQPALWLGRRDAA
jgi:hypothetical protein